MLEKVYTCPIRLQQLRRSPAGPLFEGFAHQLCQAGYTRTVVQKHIRIADHYIYWADRQGIAVADLNESSIKGFDRHLCRCRCKCPSDGRTYPLKRQNDSAHLFLGYLCGAGIAPDSARQATVSEPVLLSAFHHWMRQQRGTCNASLCNYSYSIRICSILLEMIRASLMLRGYVTLFWNDVNGQDRERGNRA
jgi:hypothetical protein